MICCAKFISRLYFLMINLLTKMNKVNESKILNLKFPPPTPAPAPSTKTNPSTSKAESNTLMK